MQSVKQNFYISLGFLLITTALLIAISICCYLIKDDFVHNRIRCLIGIKKGITYVISHNYAKIKM